MPVLLHIASIASACGAQALAINAIKKSTGRNLNGFMSQYLRIFSSWDSSFPWPIILSFLTAIFQFPFLDPGSPQIL